MKKFERVFTFQTRVTLVVDERDARLIVEYALPNGTPAVDRDTAKFPLEWFREKDGNLNQPLLDRFCDNVLFVFENTVTPALLVDFSMHLQRIGHLLGARDGLSPTSLNRTIELLSESHKKAIAFRMRVFMGEAPKPSGQGKFSKWTPESLHGCITLIMRKLPAEDRTLKRVAAEISKTNKISAKGLKQLLFRFRQEHGKQFEWQELQQFADLMVPAPEGSAGQGAAAGGGNSEIRNSLPGNSE